MLSPFVQVESVAFGAMLAWGFWGIHTVLFGWLMALLCRRRPVRAFLLVTCIAGYLISTVTVAINSFLTWEWIRLGYPGGHSSSLVKRAVIVNIFLWSTAISISDSVQMWRCIVLCGKRTWLVVILGLLLASTVVVGILNDAISIVLFYIPHPGSVNISDHLQEGTLLAFLVPSVLLNIIATSKIIARIRAHSKDILGSFGSEHRSVQRLRLLNVFLLEGGVIYTSIQLMYAIAAFLSTAGNTHASLALVSRPAVVIISGMYPLTITLFAELAGHMADTYSSRNASHEGSTIGLPIPRSGLPVLRSRQSSGQVRLTVSQTKAVDKEGTLRSIDDVEHSTSEGSPTI